MRQIFLLITLLFSAPGYTEEAKKDNNEWQNSTISDATIKKIQEAKAQYNKCISDEMQKPAYREQESRRATEALVKQCEPVLAKMRDTYLAEKVPGIVADRHLKQVRIQTTRNVLQTMMFNEAAKSAGQK